MKIAIRIRNVYGNETIYPACTISQKFAELLGQKTLTRNNLRKIVEMGFAVEHII